MPMTAPKKRDCATTAASRATSPLLAQSQRPPLPSSATRVVTLATSKVTVQTPPRAPSATPAVSLATSPESVQRPRPLLHQEDLADSTQRPPPVTSVADQTTLPRTARLVLSSATLAVRTATSPRSATLPPTSLPRHATSAARRDTSPRTVLLPTKV